MNYLTGRETYIDKVDNKNLIPIFKDGTVIPVISDQNDGIRKVIKHLCNDLKRVTTVKPELSSKLNTDTVSAIIIGTMGESKIIDAMINNGDIDEKLLLGKWDSFIIQVVKKSIVIVGSNKRGTIYGIYDFSEKIGVSPLHWWADVPVKPAEALYMKNGVYYSGEPKIKYRGFFINDEYPCLGELAHEKFGGFNSNFYSHVFELLLRLKGNYLWPAMWNDCFFDDDPENHKLANELGIIMGTSHHEPMMRSWKEWERYGSGVWDLDKNELKISNFWKESIKRMGDKESIVTVGMRGDGDEPLTDHDQVEILQKILKGQRAILQTITEKSPEKIPQLWAVYKEVQEAYEKGISVPDDIIILLCDDNWGNIRKLPPVGDIHRTGGFGLYYHFDYVGGPRNYKWINTNPIPRVWEQLSLAYNNGIDRLWIVNVGDIKPLEFPLNFFMDFAWNPENWNKDELEEYTLLWAKKQFGSQYCKEISYIISLYSKYNGRRKPELLDSTTYSIINFRESEKVIKDYIRIVQLTQHIKNRIAPEYHNAFFELIEYPVTASANLHKLHRAVALNHLYASQGRVSTEDMYKEVISLFKKDQEITWTYNNILEGKWNHIANQNHISYTYWQQPEKDELPEIKKISVLDEGKMAVAIEGSKEFWTADDDSPELPLFHTYGSDKFYFEIFNKGSKQFNFTLDVSEPWIITNKITGSITMEEKLWVQINWDLLKQENNSGKINIYSSNGNVISIKVNAKVQNIITPCPKGTFIEADGYISMESTSFSKSITDGDFKWESVPNLGRTGSAMTVFPQLTPEECQKNTYPYLEYPVYLSDSGEYSIETYLSPTNDFTSGSGLHIVISIDNEAPILADIHKDFDWDKAVGDNIQKIIVKHTVKRKGFHNIRFSTADVGIVIQKIVVYKKTLPYSYLGPDESYYTKKDIK